MGKIARRFRRELAASPKKAAVLGLLALVAMYYWTPLVWGWVAKGGGATEGGVADAPPAAAGAAAAPSAPNSPVANTAAPALPWQQVVELIESDERTLAAELHGLQRDPFARPKPSAAELKVADAAKLKAETKADALKAAEAAAAEKQQAAALTPQGLGLTLTGTIVGADRRVARIGGRSYEQGQTIQVRKDGQTIGFLLAEVHARRVVLTRDADRYELTIPDPRQSKKIELSPSGG